MHNSLVTAQPQSLVPFRMDSRKRPYLQVRFVPPSALKHLKLTSLSGQNLWSAVAQHNKHFYGH